MYKKNIKIIYLIFSMVFVFSCSNTKHLANNEILFNGHKLIINKEKNNKISPELKLELLDVLYPEKNNKFLGMRMSLWVYNHVKEPKKEKGFRNFLKYKIGEAPVKYNAETPGKIVKLLDNRLQNNGFFNCRITDETKVKNKKSKTNYTIYLTKPLKIDTVIFDINDSNITNIIKRNLPYTLILKDEIYSLAKIKKERERIVKDIRNKGYYFFRNDFLVYYTDTNNLGDKMRFYVKYKPDIDIYNKERYTFNNINLKLNSNFSDTSINKSYIKINDVAYYGDEDYFKPKRITKNIFFKNNELYSDSLYRKTLNYFYGYDIINSLNINISVNDTTKKKIDADISLSKSKTNSFEVKLSGKTKTNGFSGPSADFTFANRNIFKGGEKLSFTLETGLEKQIGEEINIDYIMRIALKGELKFPHITPVLKNLSNHSIRLPYSIIDGGVTFLRYKPTMDIWETSTSYSYRWFPTNNNTWELRPISFVYQRVFEKEKIETEDIIDLPYIPFGLENQFSLGSSVSFTTTNKYTSKTKTSYFFKSTFEIAGNLMFLMFSSLAKQQEKPYTVLEQPFSQFSRLDLDFRLYRKIKKNSMIATRFLSYLSIPYGNSVDLPFFRKYFVGGPNSLRGFQTGGIGPGTFYNPNIKPDIRINNGDIRLEANVEFRFKLIGNLYSVLFVDAGNVWLVNEDTLRPGGKFEFNKIIQSSSVSVGTGIRYDFSVIAIRLDLGFPIKYPYNETTGDVYGTINYTGEEIRKSMIFHFAIDYPF